MERLIHGLIFLFIIAILLVTGCSLVDRRGSDDNSNSENNQNQESGGEGAIIIEAQTVPAGQAGTFQFTGVPTGTISIGGSLVVSNLSPGTYTTTEVNPAPDFDVTNVECDDGNSASSSNGDPQSRTAVINLDSGETVKCTFTNASRGTLIVAGQTIPDGAGGSFQFTGVPTGTIPADGTLVVGNLAPGTYSTTEKDPAPDFDLTAVDCDDGSSASSSTGDTASRTAIFNLDPGESVTCTFTNTRRGAVVVAGETIPEGAVGTFQFTGVPTGTISGNGTLVAGNLSPGSYTTTEVDPAPEFELSAVDCDDDDSATTSSGDPQTRTAVFNLDPGETVTCTFVNSEPSTLVTPTITAGGSTTGGSTTDDSTQPSGDLGDGSNPFDNPDSDLADFPLPEEFPPEAGTFQTPLPGPWSVTHFAGQMTCDNFNLSIPASPPESGVLEVLGGGQTIIGTGLEDAQDVSITMNAIPEIRGRYSGAFQGHEQGVPVTINYFWQVVTNRYIVGFLTAEVTAQGVSCTVYRSFEMFYTG